MSELDWSQASPPPVPQCDYGEWTATRVLIPFIYLLAFFTGTLGNAFVLLVYQSCYRRGYWSHSKFKPSRRHPTVHSRSVTESLIASLAVADLAFVTTLPLWATYTAMGYHWPFGSFLCQISSYLVALNMYASVFSLAGLSAERYYVIKRCSTIKNQSPVRAWCIVGCVWLAAGVLALPALLLRTIREVQENVDWLDDNENKRNGSHCLCDMDYSALISPDLDSVSQERAELTWSALLGIKSTIIGFLLPLIVLLLCYSSLAHFLSHHFSHGPRPDRQRQRKLQRIIVVLILAFFLCWLPFHVNKSLFALVELEFLPYSCTFDRWLVAAHPYAICLAYMNSCLNPLLYACYDPAFRHKCKRLVRSVWKRREEEEQERGTREEMEEESNKGSKCETVKT